MSLRIDQIHGSFLTMTNAFTIAGRSGPMWNSWSMKGVMNWWWIEARTTEYWFGAARLEHEVGRHAVLVEHRRRIGDVR